MVALQVENVIVSSRLGKDVDLAAGVMLLEGEVALLEVLLVVAEAAAHRDPAVDLEHDEVVYGDDLLRAPLTGGDHFIGFV